MPDPEKPQHQVILEWNFGVPVENVWQAWTDPDIIKLWFGSDPEGTVLEAGLDVIPGGRFKISFQDSDGTRHTCKGTYTGIEVLSSLNFTWSWESEPGHVSFVKVLLKSMPEGTLMHFEHTGLHADSAHNYGTGWKKTFQKLASFL